MEADGSPVPELGEVLAREHVDLALVDPPDGRVDPEGHDVDHLHEGIEHLRDGRSLHGPSDLVHGAPGPGERDRLRGLEHGDHVVAVELEFGPQDVLDADEPESLEAAPVVLGERADLRHRPLPVQERVEVGEEHDDLEPRLLEVEQLVHGHHVPEVDLARGLVSGVDPLFRRIEEPAELLVGHDLDRVPRRKGVRIHASTWAEAGLSVIRRARVSDGAIPRLFGLHTRSVPAVIRLRALSGRKGRDGGPT